MGGILFSFLHSCLGAVFGTAVQALGFLYSFARRTARKEVNIPCIVSGVFFSSVVAFLARRLS
jgi:hypothetical protein